MKVRVQVLLTEEERERIRSRAEAEGTSMSGWLREAGLERLRRERRQRRIDSSEALEEFFEACDEREAGRGDEPDWEEHLEVIRRSRGDGASET